MNQTIYKFNLMVDDYQIINLPIGSKILCVQTQDESPYIWALVKPNEIILSEHHIRTFGTGHDVPDNERLNYIGTYQLKNGALVFHVFESLI